MSERFSFGLLGYPLEHSLSPLVQEVALQAHDLQGEYNLYPVSDKRDLPGMIGQLREGRINGLNVTIPYKHTVSKMMDVLSTTASLIGAVNTISFQHNQLVGDNTDADGFIADLERLGWFPEADQLRSALVLGAGGAARAIVYALRERGWQLTVAARRIEQTEILVQSLSSEPSGRHIQGKVKSSPFNIQSLEDLEPPPDLIINTTPLGMYPHLDASPWPSGLALPSKAAVYDLVYNPAQTAFIGQAQEAGLRATGGIGMLVEQAARSFEIWTGLVAPRLEMHRSVVAYIKGGR
ncbi:MAG: shikimate dehydrogenase [Anaerolineales bacterium]|jgi:shikimate dehydrogenase